MQAQIGFRKDQKTMSILKKAKTQGRMFVGIYGPEGSGKSRTAVEIAIAGRKTLGLTGPIVAFDTEHAYGFQARRIKEATGEDLLIASTRSVQSLRDGLKEAKRELREEYRKKKGKESLDVGDYVAADRPFKSLLDAMLRSHSNIILCGREGQKYGLRKNSRGTWVQGPVASKMNAGEAGYEVDLLLELSRKEGKTGGWTREANVKKDRSDTVSAQTFQVPWDPAEALAGYFAHLQG
jgi:hypothetical protein